MKKLAILTILPLLALQTPAAACAESRMVAGSCTTQETTNLSVNFSGMSDTAKAVKASFEDKLKKIEVFAKEAGITELNMQSQSYNIYTQNNGGGISGYQYNGSANYLVKPADKATDLLELLTKNNMQSSLSVNSYRSGNCEGVSDY